MTVDTLYTLTDQKQGTKRVVIDGVILPKVYGVTWNFAIGRVPTATIRVPFPPPGLVGYFSDVTVEAGFNNVNTRVFTGKVMNVGGSEREALIECAGLSQFLERPSSDTEILIDNITNIAAITAVFAAAGISFFEITLPSFTMGTNVVSTLTFQTFAEAITKIAEIDGGRWAETPTGLIRVFAADPIPRIGVNRTYFAMNLTALVEAYPSTLTAADGRPRIRTVRRTPRVQDTKNRIHVRGTTQTVGDVSTDIEADLEADSPFVLGPDGAQSFNDLVFANDLVDTTAKAEEVALRLLGVHNRLKVTLALTIEGDPLRQLGDSLRVEDERYSGTTGQWFLENYRSVMTQSDFVTSITAIGEGAETDLDPVAEFSWKVMHLVFDDMLHAIITFDGRASFDPDGAIASYSWSDNQGTPLISGTDAIVTACQVDPATISPTPWRVTLTVTDSDGNTASVTHDIDVAICATPEVPQVIVPTIFTAFDSHFSGSQDGAQSWNDQAGTAIISVAAHPTDQGEVVYGQADGQIFRTEDGAFSAPTSVLAAVGSPIVSIAWDDEDFTVVWALTQDGRVYRSQDEGASWLLYNTLSVTLSLPSMRGGKILPLGGALLVFGGEGNSPGLPLILHDEFKNNVWVKALLGGDLLADMIAATPADLFVRDAAFNGGFQLWECAIILNSSSHTPAVYYTTDLRGDGSTWTRAVGAPANSRGRWVAADLAFERFALGFDDVALYTGDVAGGVITIAAAAATLDLGEAANQGIWVGQFVPEMGAVYVISVEGPFDGTIYLSCDRLANIEPIRPAAGFPPALAGMNAEQTTFGVKAKCPELYAQEEDLDETLARLDFNVWTDLGSDPITLNANWHLIHLGANFYRINNHGVSIGGGPGILERSTAIDTNVWTTAIDKNSVVSGGYGPRTVTRDARGFLWSATSSTGADTSEPMRLWRSIDEGASWQQVVTGFEGVGGAQLRCVDIACDPNNADVIMLAALTSIIGSPRVIVSTDGGVSWVNLAGPTISLGYWLKFADGGRIVNSSGLGIKTSDDQGASWVTKQTPGGGATPNAQFLIGSPFDRRRLAYAHNDLTNVFRVFISRDNGETWELIGDALTIPTSGPGLVALGWPAGTPCWSGLFLEDGSLIIGSRPSAAVWRNPAPFAIPVPAWQNWSFSLSGIIGNIGQQGLATRKVQMEP